MEKLFYSIIFFILFFSLINAAEDTTPLTTAQMPLTTTSQYSLLQTEIQSLNQKFDSFQSVSMTQSDFQTFEANMQSHFDSFISSFIISLIIVLCALFVFFLCILLLLKLRGWL